MASLVADILLSAGNGKLEKRDWQTEIAKVNQKIEDAKFQVVKFLEQNYVEFNPLLVHSRELDNISTELVEKVNHLMMKSETELKMQLECSSTELNTIGSQINAAKLQVDILSRVAHLHTILETLKKIDMESDIVHYSKLIAEADTIIHVAEDSIDTELDIWSAVQFEVERYKDQLVEFLEESWNSQIAWSRKDTLTSLKLEASRLKDTFVALSSIEQLDRLLSEWSTRLLEEILTPLMKADSSVQCQNDLLEVMDGETKVTELNDLAIVLRNVSCIFQHLNGHLGFDVGDKSVLRLVGEQIADEFVQLLIKNCLKPTMPASSALLSSPEYSDTMKCVQVLEEELLSVHFLKDRLMGEFAANVDVFFADKQCLESLSKARQLMCLDLHDTIMISKEDQNQTMVSAEENEETAHLWKMLGEGGMEIKWSPFRFPQCQISRSTQDLVELLTGLVLEAGLPTATERCSARLLFTVRSICELYMSVVPEYHRDHLEKLPFHAAVAHNNGMFLAHSILTLGKTTLIRVVANAVPLMDLVGKFRTLAAQIFLDHMKKQRDQLLSIFKEAGFNRLSEGESRLPDSAEKAGRQCLLQLGNLQKIWKPTLPEEVYLRAIGTLANAVLEELIQRITTLEDIPAAAALQLADQCQSFTNALPQLFSTEMEDEEDSPTKKKKTGQQQVHQYVHLWSRFQELRHLLSAGLKDIEDRWSSGKGPLAAHFAADEVKSMVRALFQNTDLRATTLSRIK